MKTWEEITIAEVKEFCKKASLERLDLAHWNICKQIEECKLQISAARMAIKACAYDYNDPQQHFEWLDFLCEIHSKMDSALKLVAQWSQYKHDGYWKQWEPDWAITKYWNYIDVDDPDYEYWMGQYEAMLDNRARNCGIHIRRQHATA